MRTFIVTYYDRDLEGDEDAIRQWQFSMESDSTMTIRDMVQDWQRILNREMACPMVITSVVEMITFPEADWQ